VDVAVWSFDGWPEPALNFLCLGYSRSIFHRQLQKLLLFIKKKKCND